MENPNALIWRFVPRFGESGNPKRSFIEVKMPKDQSRGGVSRIRLVQDPKAPAAPTPKKAA